MYIRCSIIFQTYAFLCKYANTLSSKPQGDDNYETLNYYQYDFSLTDVFILILFSPYRNFVQ